MRDMETTQNQTTAPTLKFSVAMCVYKGDNAEHFDLALKSVTDDQTVKPDEIVLVVDGPVTEALDAVIEKYATQDFFNVIRLETNQGHGNARRIGLKACHYDLVALMDADDISASDRFEKQLEKFTNTPSLSLVGGNISEFIGESKNIVGYRLVSEDQKSIESDLKKRCPFNQVTVMFKKSAVEKVGGYVDWFCEEDYYLWLRMYLADMEFCNLSDILVNVRVGEDMYRRRGGWKYFQSEAKLQNYMRKNKIIGFGTYFVNVTKRFIVQILLPNKLRGWVFKKFARKSNV